MPLKCLGELSFLRERHLHIPSLQSKFASDRKRKRRCSVQLGWLAKIEPGVGIQYDTDVLKKISMATFVALYAYASPLRISWVLAASSRGRYGYLPCKALRL